MLGTFSSGGRAVKKMAKALVSLVMLPDTVRQIRRDDLQAKRMLRTFPQIPTMGDQNDLLEIEVNSL
jgi:hypothetical protein